tara:strand:- start:14838 stop:16085 length:1248 start_codon:yes stop_codon:yes gene_type:complete
MPNKVLVISKMANMPGSCPAEWVDDRVLQLKKEGKEVHIISGSYALRYPKEIKHFRIPSISIFEAAQEYFYAKQFKSDVFDSFFMNFYLTTCHYLSIVFKKFRLGIFKGEGNWFWTISSTIFALSLILRNKYELIYTTGGPASAHLSGIIASKILFKKVIVELQDPLTGFGIGRNKISSFGLNYIEKFIIKNSDQIAFVTKSAMEECKSKYPKYAEKINFIYPGSIHQEYFKSSQETKKDKINIAYTGSLYGSRNIKSFLTALTNLEKVDSIKYNINILGSVTEEIQNDIKSFKNINISLLGRSTRDESIEMIKKADVLLLIQHADDRSSLTIPFKLYDYINSGNLIFGLLYKNKELKNLLLQNGHLSTEINNIIEIENELKNLFSNFTEINNKIKVGNLTTSKAVKKMYQLYNT